MAPGIRGKMNLRRWAGGLGYVVRVWRTLGFRICFAPSALLLAAVASGCLAAPAGAKVIIDHHTGRKFGIVPPPALPLAVGLSPLVLSGASATPTCTTSVDPSCNSTLVNPNNGPVQHGETDYLFFWGPSSAFPSSYVSGMQGWLSDLQAGDYSGGKTSGSQAGNPLSVLQQYYDNSGPGPSKRFVPYAVQNAGTIMDTNPYPASGCTDSYTDPYTSATDTLGRCLTAAQLTSELSAYVSAHNLPTGIDVEYFVLTPQGVGSCSDGTSSDCAQSTYCGWHTFTGTGSSQIVFADMPWLGGTACDAGRSQSAGDLYPNTGIDSVVGTFSHELAETMTDPNLNAWQGSGGGSDEVGDKCAYQYGVGDASYSYSGLPQTSSGAYYNVTLGDGDNYLLQMEYDNRAGGCNLWNTDSQPTASISAPSQVTGGSPSTFSLANVSDPAGIAYVEWDFGDGSSTATSTGTSSIQHTYATSGGYPVTAIVTDNDGNEVKLTACAGTCSLANITPPTISGTPQQGQMLSLTQGAWMNSTSITDQWEDCDVNGQNCVAIGGATGSAYALQRSDAGHTIRVAETANGTGGPATATSARTAVVDRLGTVNVESAGSAISGLSDPEGIAVNSAGDLFIADTIHDQVVEKVPNGSGGYTESPVANGLLSAHGIALDGAGDVFVTSRPSHEVVEEKPNGSGGYSQSVVANSTNGLDFPYAVLVDGSGDVFISDNTNNNVLEEKPNGSGYTQSVVAGAANGLSGPAGLALDSAGDLFVVDSNNNRILEETPSGSGYSQSVVISGIPYPSGVAVDSSGDLFATERGYDRVIEETPGASGAYTRKVVESDVLATLDFDQALAVDPQGRVFITSDGNDAVVEEQPLSSGGYAQTSIANNLNEPNGVAVDSAGDLVVTDNSTSALLEKPDGSGGYWQSQISTDLFGGSGVAIDAAGNLFIGDLNNHRIVEETPTGSGSYTEKAVVTGLNYATGVAVDSSNALFITDEVNKQLLKEVPNGSGGYVQSVIPTPSSSTLAVAPWDVVVDASGDLFVTDVQNGTLLEERPNGSGGYTQSTVGTGMNQPKGVNLGQNGVLFVADSQNDRVLEYVPNGNGGYTPDVLASGLSQPQGVGFASNGDALIAEGGNGFSNGGDGRVIKQAPLPTVSIPTPASGGIYAVNQSVPTSFSCSDASGGPGISSCVDGAGASSPGHLDTSTLGKHTYTVTAASQDGKTMTGSVSYTVAQAPAEMITSKFGGTYAQGQTATTGFFCSDGAYGPGIASCVDSNGANAGTGTLDTSTTGSHTYTVTATSLDGQTSSETMPYNVATPPSATISAPAAGGIYAVGQHVSTSFSCSKGISDPGIGSCVDSNGASGTAGVLNTSTPGTYTYTVTATSVDGLSGSSSISYTVAGAPTASIASPAAGQTYAVNQSVPTSFSCADGASGPGISSCMDSNGASGTAGVLDTSTPGAYTYTVTATSSDGQTGTESIPYTVAAAPSVAITSPTDGATYAQGSVVDSSFSCADGSNGPGIASCLDASAKPSGAAIDTSSTGLHTFTVTAKSSDGQTATSKPITYTVAAAPTASIASPADGQTYAVNQSVATSFSCTDGASGPGIQSCVDSNGASGDSGQLNTSTVGQHTYNVTATSTDGQTATSKPITYTVAAAPTASIGSPSTGGTYVLGQTVPTSFSCAEGASGPGISTCKDSNGATGGSGQLNTSTSGPHTYTVSATSKDGQTATKSISYTVVGLPSASISSPSSGGTYEVGQIVPTSFSCAEGASGPGISSCKDSNGATGGTGRLLTADPGQFTYTVVAASKDGQSAPTSITYMVVPPPSASLGSARVSGNDVKLAVSCAGRTGTCSVAATLTVIETLKSGKVVAVAAINRRTKVTKKTIVLGEVTATVAAGQGKVLVIALNAAGKKLLSQHRSLTVHLAVAEAGHVFASRAVTFSAKAGTRKRR